VAVPLSASRYVNCPDVYDFNQWENGGVINVLNPASNDTLVLMYDDEDINAAFVNAAECGDECHPINKCDFDNDCDVDFGDFAGFASAWSPGLATEIPFENAGFEDPSYQGGDPDWVTAFGDAGRVWGKVCDGWTSYAVNHYITYGKIISLWDEGWEFFFPGIDQTPYGQQIADAGGSNDGWEQTLSATLESGKTYALNFDLGYGNDGPSGLGEWHLIMYGDDDWYPAIELNINVNTGQFDGAEDGLEPVDRGTWKRQHILLETDGSTDGLGEPITVRFWGIYGFRVDNIEMHVVDTSVYDETNAAYDLNDDFNVGLEDLAIFVLPWTECTSVECLNN